MKKRLPKAVTEARLTYVKRVLDECFDNNKSAMGRRLGYVDGSFIGQVLTGRRALTEETIAAISELSEVKNAGIKSPDLGVMAHLLSQPSFEDKPLTKGQIMEMGLLPSRFVYVLEDDALAPDFRAGTHVLFDRCDDASHLKIGAGMLLKDADGELHVRRKAQGGAAGAWIGKATTELYRDLDGSTVEILGWWRGVINRGLED